MERCHVMITPYEAMVITSRHKRITDAFDAVKKRKDGFPDMRFSSSRLAAKLESRLVRLAELRWIQSGG